MCTLKVVVFAAMVATLLVATTTPAWAQGCVLIRESAPVIGAASSTYLRPGEWQLDVSYRDSKAFARCIIATPSPIWRNVE